MKISFCTTCMGRLHHLEQTLPINLMNSENYRNKEFVVVNYNSNDGMHNWAKENLKPWIKKGIVKYCRTQLPINFSATHAKNIAYKQASGDVLCNLDADNFVMEGFCEYLSEIMKTPDSFYYAYSVDACGNHGCCGKIAVKKEHFYSVNGYDEEQNLGWGWDDVSFRFRTKMHNKLIGIPGDTKWNWVIGHDNYERTINFKNKDIMASTDWSVNRLQQISIKAQYIVNSNRRWGEIEDLKINDLN